MILRRIATAIKTQDWFQVTVEILIVVIGIFLGLQVTDWNDGREAKADEDRFIGYMIADIENTITEIADSDEFYNDQISAGERLLELLEGDELAPEDIEDFEYGLGSIGFNNGVDNYLRSMQNDDLDQILGPDMRRTINNFLGKLNVNKTIILGNRTSIFNIAPYVRTRAVVEDATRKNRLIDYDFEKLRNDDEFRTRFKAIMLKIKNIQFQILDTLDDSEKLLAVLNKYQNGEDIEEVTFQ